ncbi:unnamed protein product [Polarella glacialis]|uniref:Uncharacterized protein n=1 Tax=Polarella glacialis TaxID=89957 RepID=A0A813E756_POLGL|nr:unnamed protein product [Polarella glacialis]
MASSLLLAQGEQAEELLRSGQVCSKHSQGAVVFLEVRNSSELPVEICWVDFNGCHQGKGCVAPGLSWTQTSGAGHAWLFSAGGSRCVFFAHQGPPHCVCRIIIGKAAGEGLGLCFTMIDWQQAPQLLRKMLVCETVYRRRRMMGFDVYADQELRGPEWPGAFEEDLRALSEVVPQPALAVLRRTPIFMNVRACFGNGENYGACFHPSRRWLKENCNKPVKRKTRSVEVYRGGRIISKTATDTLEEARRELLRAIGKLPTSLRIATTFT